MEISTDLYPAERQQHILAHLNRNGRASVSELSRLFGVSEVTIRTDLQALVAGDLIVRTHGGAVLATRAPELSLTLRRQQQVDAKERIGAAAAEFVANGDAVFLDASSTALALAHALRQRRDLTILTHSLVVAQSMLDASGVTVVMTGGTLQRETVSLMGTDGLAILRKYNLKAGFFGAHGLSFPEGSDRCERRRGRGEAPGCGFVPASGRPDRRDQVGPGRAGFLRPAPRTCTLLSPTHRLLPGWWSRRVGWGRA